jgi:hypothetical protein
MARGDPLALGAEVALGVGDGVSDVDVVAEGWRWLCPCPWACTRWIAWAREPVGEAVGEEEEVGVGLGRGRRGRRPLAVADGDVPLEGLGEGLPVVLPVADGEAVARVVGLGDGGGVPVGVLVADGVSVAVGLGDAAAVGLGVAVGDGGGNAVDDGVLVGLCLLHETLAVGDPVGLAEGVALRDRVPVGDGVLANRATVPNWCRRRWWPAGVGAGGGGVGGRRRVGGGGGPRHVGRRRSGWRWGRRWGGWWAWRPWKAWAPRGWWGPVVGPWATGCGRRWCTLLAAPCTPRRRWSVGEGVHAVAPAPAEN